MTKRKLFAVAMGLLVLGTTPSPAWAGRHGASLVNISAVSNSFATGVPQVAISRSDPNLVAVAWRKYALPINTNADVGDRTAECHVAVSNNGGRTFRDTDLTPILREHTDEDLPTDPAPGLWFCNWSWVSIGDDSTIYAGGAMFTPLGDVGPVPKQGRAMVTASRDYGRSWRPPSVGIKLANFAPGLTGLTCADVRPCVSSPDGTDPWHTPWDNAMGVAAPGSRAFYSMAGGYVVASEDRAKTFGTVYRLDVPGWTITTRGKIDASRSRLVAPIIASSAPFAATCPCLAMATSTDEGKSWTARLVAEAGEFNPSGAGDTARYPFAAVDPRHPLHYAVLAFTPDHRSVQVYSTTNNGASWKNAVVRPVSSNRPIARAAKAGLGYTTNGKILVVWRAFQAPDNPDVPGGPGAFDTYAALLDEHRFGPSVRVSPQSSTYPVETTVGSTAPDAADYNLNNGGGDFSTWITGDDRSAYVAFPYAPRGAVLDTYLAKIPLKAM
ncbi:hypothetical protein AB0J74_17995 [Asanoa sp. NPDC049573]|uniref:hypothetical protein n=1 Tax=Asanoa sp. NPDC049573 TaxID=3155396 RepID=UPI00342D112A